MAEVRHYICRSDDLVDGGSGVRFMHSPAVGAAKVTFGGTAPAPGDEAKQGGIGPPDASPTPNAFVVRFRGQARAYLNRCGHIPVQLDWEAGEFFDFSGQYLICATHGALYAPESGHCLGGRCAGKGLSPVPVLECDGAIYWLETTQGT